MKMAPITLTVGVLLILLGVGGYTLSWISNDPQPTALIPAIFGLVLVILGWLARQEKLRMHVMHAAVIIGLVGFVIPAMRLASKLKSGPFTWDLASIALVLMTLICFVFVVLCVKSFIDARRQRKREQQTPAG
jgi:Na+/alanine symporter